MSKVNELVEEFVSKLAAEFAGMPARDLAALAGESNTRLTTRAPRANGNGTNGTSAGRKRNVTLDEVVNAVKDEPQSVTASFLTGKLRANQGSVSRFLKEAVATGRLQKRGKARGTHYSAITIDGTIPLPPPPPTGDAPAPANDPVAQAGMQAAGGGAEAEGRVRRRAKKK